MKLLAKVAIAVLLGGGVTAIYAQPGSPGSASASAEQARARATQLHDQVTDDLGHIQHLQAEARKARDVIKLNCVNDKLVQAKPLVNLADTAMASIDSDPGGAISQMSESGEQVRRLREDSDQCIGQPVLGTESANSFTSPDNFDPTQTNPFGGVGGGIEAPVYASPFN